MSTSINEVPLPEAQITSGGEVTLDELQDVTEKAIKNLNALQRQFDALCTVQLGICIESNEAPSQSVVRRYRDLLARLTVARKEFLEAQEASSQAFKARTESREPELSRD